MLVEVEHKQDAKYGSQVTELKNELELLMKGKFHEHFKNHEAKQQVVLDLMGDLEKKMDHRG